MSSVSQPDSPPAPAQLHPRIKIYNFWFLKIDSDSDTRKANLEASKQGVHKTVGDVTVGYTFRESGCRY